MQPSLPALPSVPNKPLIATSLLPSAASPVNLPTAAPNVFANMVFDNPFSFEDIFSRSYAGNVIRMALPQDNDDFGIDTLEVTEEESPVLEYIHSAITHVETKMKADEKPPDFDEDPEQFQQQLQNLLDEYSDRFDESDMTVSNMPPVDIKLKPEAKGKTFYKFVLLKHQSNKM